MRRVAERRQLRGLRLGELYALLVSLLSSGDDEHVREEAVRVVNEMILRASELQVRLGGLPQKMQPTIVNRLAEVTSKLVSTLTSLSVKLPVASRREISELLVSTGSLIGFITVFQEAPGVAPLGGLVSREEVTDVAAVAGGVGARVYGFLVSRGRASSRAVREWGRAVGIGEEELEDALRRLMERGLIRAEYVGGDLVYAPSGE